MGVESFRDLLCELFEGGGQLENSFFTGDDPFGNFFRSVGAE